jgi:predicted benzoate:H+ symporter BenE
LRREELHDIAEILLKVALNTIKQTNKQTSLIGYYFEFYYTACFLSFSYNVAHFALIDIRTHNISGDRH